MEAQIQIGEEKPDHFSAHVEVAAAYVNCKGRILLLQNSSHKSEGGLWGVPAGKLEKGESALQAVRRELFEETGINLPQEAFFSCGKLYISKPEVNYVYHLFGAMLDSEPSVQFCAEHSAYRWVSKEEAEQLPLMKGANAALDAYYKHLPKKKRQGSSVNVYLVLQRGDEILLHLRKNTGYCDGCYGLISGHVEDGESAIDAMVREAHEEAGLQIEAAALKLAHVIHRKTDRQNIDLFFTCDAWEGVPTNRETEKCAALDFFPIDQLPLSTIDYIQEALKVLVDGKIYSERGWK